MQAQLLGNSQDGVTGAVFAAVENLEGLRVIDGNHALAERQLQEFELFQ
jgi:hypothetical protein